MKRLATGFVLGYLLSQPLLPYATAMAMRERRSNHQSSSSSSSSRKTSLLFQGDVSTESSPLPEQTTPADLSNFFHDRDSRLAFASGGDSNNAEELELTSEWESQWKKCCERWYGPAFCPQRGDSLFKCREYSKFPGITVCTTVYTGFKTMPSGRGVPSCCFVVIGQSQSAKGLPPIVWIFHQLMGTKPPKKGSVESSSPSAVADPWGPIKSFYSAEKQPSGRWIFRLQSSMQIKVEFPSRLLKLLPSSKKRVEAQGSAGITKTIAKAGEKGMVSVHEAFVKHQCEQQQQASSLFPSMVRPRKRRGFGGIGLLPIAY